MVKNVKSEIVGRKVENGKGKISLKMAKRGEIFRKHGVDRMTVAVSIFVCMSFFGYNIMTATFYVLKLTVLLNLFMDFVCST